MFSVSTSVVLVIFFVSQALGQSASTVGPSVNSSVCSSVNSSVSPSGNSSMCPSVNSSVKLTSTTLSTPSSITAPSETPTKMSEPTVPPSKKTVGQNSTTVGPRVSQSVKSNSSSAVVSFPYVSSTPKLTSTTLPTPPPSTALSITSSITTPFEPPTTTIEQPTAPSSKKTCAMLSVVINIPWIDDYGNRTSEKFLNVSDLFSSALKKLYGDTVKYIDVEVSAVNVTNKEGKLFAQANLSLVFKGGGAVFIEDVFKNKVATGKLDADLPVVKGSAEFEPLGVSWMEWKAKEGECEEKCDRAAGPFLIVRGCQDEGCSCKGLKKSKETDKCTKYCPSDKSSTVAVTVSSVILVIGIFLSSSFQ